MSSFTRLIRFEGEEDGQPYFADLGSDFDRLPVPGAKLGAFRSIDGLADKTKAKTVTMRRVRSPPPLYKCRGAQYSKLHVAAGTSSARGSSDILRRPQLSQPR
jgi:hypothetical protein